MYAHEVSETPARAKYLAERQARKDAGLCSQCGREPAEPGRLLGESCRVKGRASHRRGYIKKLEAEGRTYVPRGARCTRPRLAKQEPAPPLPISLRHLPRDM